MLCALRVSRYSTRPSSPLRSAQPVRLSRDPTRSMSGTPKPHDVEMRVTSTSMIARAPGNGRELGASASNSSDPRACTVPRPWSRQMRGGPSNAHSMIVMRPFSRRCAMVSTPLPVRSRYATRCGPRIARPARPFGERFTWPSAPLGAVATKNIGCSEIQCARSVLISSSVAAMTRFSQVGGGTTKTERSGWSAR